MLPRAVGCDGARRGEIVALRWSDIDRPNRSVAISRGVLTGPDGPGRERHSRAGGADRRSPLFLEQSERVAADVMGRLISINPDEPTSQRRESRPSRVRLPAALPALGTRSDTPSGSDPAQRSGGSARVGQLRHPDAPELLARYT